MGNNQKTDPAPLGPPWDHTNLPRLENKRLETWYFDVPDEGARINLARGFLEINKAISESLAGSGVDVRIKLHSGEGYHDLETKEFLKGEPKDCQIKVTLIREKQ